MKNEVAQGFYGELAKGNGDRYLTEARRFIPAYDVIIGMATDLLKSNLSQRVLDIGSGVGNVEEIILKKSPNAQIICVETSPEMARASRERLASYGDQIKILNMDILDYKPEQGFDAALSNIALHNIPYDKKEGLIRNIRDWLNPGGLFVWSDLIKYNNDEVQKRVTEQRLRFAMANGATEEFARENFEKEGKHDYPLTMEETWALLEKVRFGDEFSVGGIRQGAFALFRANKTK